MHILTQEHDKCIIQNGPESYTIAPEGKKDYQGIICSALHQ